MITRKIGDKEINFNDTLRVVYDLTDTFGVETFQETFEKIQKSSFDERLSILYVAYKDANQIDEKMSPGAFKDFLLDNVGIVALSSLIQKVIHGITYAGATEEEIAENEAEVKNA